ncbi:unnamed protein product [Paramecium pentaurelia]|uniref:Uncharacterized protein n=1 Tax=Paramecium pentaurelia TaxID=43138 RepID=A0A8S1UE54_9CILI|nr:unnamed protein product [Paramecium pentaurelia]
MASSILNLLAGMSVGFYLTYNVDDDTHQTFHKEIYVPVKNEMKQDDEPNYWTRVFNVASNGTQESVKYLRKKYTKENQYKKN